MKIVNSLCYYCKIISSILPFLLLISQVYFILNDVNNKEREIIIFTNSEIFNDCILFVVKCLLAFLIGGIFTEMKFDKLGIC